MSCLSPPPPPVFFLNLSPRPNSLLHLCGLYIHRYLVIKHWRARDGFLLTLIRLRPPPLSVLYNHYQNDNTIVSESDEPTKLCVLCNLIVEDFLINVVNVFSLFCKNIASKGASSFSKVIFFYNENFVLIGPIIFFKNPSNLLYWFRVVLCFCY